MRHTAKFIDASVRHVCLTPPAPTWRAVILGGVHGDEMPARLAPAQVVRSMIFGQSFFAAPPELADCEIIVIPEAHPEACALGLRDGDGNGDLNCSWPGGVHPQYSSEQSMTRAAAVAELLLAFRPAVVVGLHSMKGPWHTSGLLHAAPAVARVSVDGVPLEHWEYSQKVIDLGVGLPGWASRHGISAVELEAPSPSLVCTETLALTQAQTALQLVVELSK